MIYYNLTICSYCFNVYAFDDININLLTSSCTLHSRKFPTKPSVHICIVLYMTLYRLHLNSFSFLNICFSLLLGFRRLIPLLNYNHQGSTL